MKEGGRESNLFFGPSAVGLFPCRWFWSFFLNRAFGMGMASSPLHLLSWVAVNFSGVPEGGETHHGTHGVV